MSPITEELVKDWRGVKGLESRLLDETFALNDCLDQGVVIIEVYRATITANFTTPHSFQPPFLGAKRLITETSTGRSLVTAGGALAREFVPRLHRLLGRAVALWTVVALQ